MKNILRNTSRSILSPVYNTGLIRLGLSISLACLSYTSFGQAKTAVPAPITVGVQQIVTNVQGPTAMAFPGGGDVWVTEQNGKIRVIRDGKMLDGALLDLHDKLVKLNNGYEERGLLGIALHPQFKTNKKFYVYYSVPSTQGSNHTGVLAEYTIPAGAEKLDPNSGRVIFTEEEPDGNHNGGCIQFGPDNFLYVSLGDGGGQGDKHGPIGNGQAMDTWHGKILRIDINTADGYTVPKDNPFVGKAGVKPEIWAYGFRNPYRFSFDRKTGDLFAGDVGQDLWEEIDIVKKGANYGWRLVEGTHCYNPATGCDISGITMPITEYSHREGVSVIAGYVYNGQQVPILKNRYLFADWTGPVFYLKKTGVTWQRGKVTLQNLPPNLKITAFGEDPSGELYILTNPDTGPENTKGSVYKVVK
ncbi:PQQ-dependent sugar dehydrogenase [Mucilaginibacter gynuensis]|uniref:PQQ-dependent sugar dehydrogenase n=1 Tax=Mucilaginibacter gynuensis TaxID=1302236 RepID=A0ABP8FVR1_9SPHI